MIEKKIKVGKHPLYQIWNGMIQRCFNDKRKNYHRYGGRGITVCDRWLDFNNFIADMESTYQKGLTIDRIDNNGNYSPNNCKWSTTKEQANNRRNNHFITYQGMTKTLMGWANYLNLKHSTLAMRIEKYGWSIEKALTRRVQPF